MRIVWKEQFKEKFSRLEKRLRDPKPLRKSLNKVIFALQTGKNPADYFPVNRVVSAGTGWYDCYLYEDIVMVYKIQGQRVVLAGGTGSCYRRMSHSLRLSNCTPT